MLVRHMRFALLGGAVALAAAGGLGSATFANTVTTVNLTGAVTASGTAGITSGVSFAPKSVALGATTTMSMGTTQPANICRTTPLTPCAPGYPNSGAALTVTGLRAAGLSFLSNGDTSAGCKQTDADTVSCRYPFFNNHHKSDNFKFTVAPSATPGNYGLAVDLVVFDKNPPVFADVPAPATIEATSPAGATYTYTLPTATDAVDGDRPVTCTPISGSTMSLGQSKVTCSASDAHGYDGTASWTVDVVDTTGPTITGTPASHTLEATGPTGAPLNYTVPTASDLVDGTVPATCTTPSGSIVPLGKTVVSCNATDGRNNTTETTFTVTVADTTAPVITVPSSVQADATAPTGATVTYTTSASDLVDGGVTTLCSPTSGSTFAIGDTRVTCTATDAAGNEGSRTFTVHVNSAAEQAAALRAAVTGVGPGTSLADKVGTLQTQVAAGNAAAAHGILKALINEVQAQTGKKIDSNQAAGLVQRAQRIQGALGYAP